MNFGYSDWRYYDRIDAATTPKPEGAVSIDVVEQTRRAFKPEKIMTLFVGESAPASGDFFYYGTSAMTRYMRRAIEDALGPTDDFLTCFKGLGWYLDDLVLVPVDKLERVERIATCRAAQTDLAVRIAEYRPEAIVTFLLSIQDIVESAAVSAESKAPRYAVPFPGMGQQGRFLTKMKALIPLLPRSL